MHADLRDRLDSIRVGRVDSRTMAYRVLATSGVLFPPDIQQVNELDAECVRLVGEDKVFGEGVYPELILGSEFDRSVDVSSEDLTLDDHAVLSPGFRFTREAHDNSSNDGVDGTMSLYDIFDMFDPKTVSEETAWRTAVDRAVADFEHELKLYGAAYTVEMVYDQAWALLDADELPQGELETKLLCYIKEKMEAMK